MFVGSLVKLLAKIVSVSSRNDDDLVDQLHHFYTVTFLLCFSLVTSTYQYVGQPIHCWIPAEYIMYEDYIHDACWVTQTYVTIGQTPPNTRLTREYYLKYYQWVPLFFLIQAFFFYIPCVGWRIFSDRSGININNMVEAAETIQNALYPERRDKTIKYMIRHLDHYLDYQREYRGGCCSPLRLFLARYLSIAYGNRYGNYLVGVYMTIKTVYFTNSLLQLFLLNVFLETDYHVFGYDVLVNALLGNGIEPPRRFPRITFCDLFVTKANNVFHKHTLECVLTVNFFNEKLFLFLWFWYVSSSVCMLLSFIRWVWVIGFRFTRMRYVRRHLLIMGKISTRSNRDRRLSYRFTELYLRLDGVFILKLVAKNSSDLVVADIVSALWEHYKNKHFTSAQDADLDDSDSIE